MAAPIPGRAFPRGRGARALPGRPGREGAGGGGSGARRLGRGRAGTAGEGRRKRRRARAITAGIINNRKENNHRRVERSVQAGPAAGEEFAGAGAAAPSTAPGPTVGKEGGHPLSTRKA